MGKKRAFALIMLSVLMVLTSCSLLSKEKEPKLGKYVLEHAEFADRAWVLLEKDSRFEFNRSMLTSYLPTGTYSVKGDILTLTVNNDEAYTFVIEEEKLVFESGTYADGLINKGAVFVLTDED